LSFERHISLQRLISGYISAIRHGERTHWH